MKRSCFQHDVMIGFYTIAVICGLPSLSSVRVG